MSTIRLVGWADLAKGLREYNTQHPEEYKPAIPKKEMDRHMTPDVVKQFCGIFNGAGTTKSSLEHMKGASMDAVQHELTKEDGALDHTVRTIIEHQTRDEIIALVERILNNDKKHWMIQNQSISDYFFARKCAFLEILHELKELNN